MSNLVGLDPFRDPVEILTHALSYLETTRGVRAKKSQAWEILDSRRDEIEKCCIEDILSEKMRRSGIHCVCRRHPWYVPATPDQRQTDFNAAITELGIRESEARRTEEPEERGTGHETRDTAPHRIHGKEAASGERDE